MFAVREHFMAHNLDTNARPQLDVCEPAHKYRTHKPKQKQNEASYWFKNLNWMEATRRAVPGESTGHTPAGNGEKSRN